MGAEIVWREGRHGILRFGPEFQSSARRDPYIGSGHVTPMGDTCLIEALSVTRTFHWFPRALQRVLDWWLGRPAEFDAREWLDVAAACAAAGFRFGEVERNGRRLVFDLTASPVRRVRIQK